MKFFFPGPALEKTDITGFFSPGHHFMFYTQSPGAGHGLPQALGLMGTAEHAPVGGLPQSMAAHGKNLFQISKAFRQGLFLCIFISHFVQTPC